MSKLIFKIVLFAVLFLALVQTITYYTIAKSSLIRVAGKNFQSFVLDQNTFTGITFVTQYNINQELVKKRFSSFEDYDIIISSDFVNVFAPINANRYEYVIKNESNNPFGMNQIKELEHAPEFVASFESKYIWILFYWVLIEKENTGIS